MIDSCPPFVTSSHSISLGSQYTTLTGKQQLKGYRVIQECQASVTSPV